jgi:hypothetical protein
MKDYIIKDNKYYITKIKSDLDPIYIKPDLENIFQDSPIIANVKMENLKWIDDGCRATGLYRLFFQRLLTLKKVSTMMDFTIKDFDDLADKSDSWSADIINGIKITKAINQKFGTAFNWYGYTKGFDILNILKLLNQDIGIVAHMESLVKGDHFINIIGYLDDENNNIYFVQKDTYQNYDGYNYLMNWKTPSYLELIY